MSTRTVNDPFVGADVQISDRLTDRLRGQYACGPHLPNGNPEFGWRQFQSPPIQHEAAERIEVLEAALGEIARGRNDCGRPLAAETARQLARDALIRLGAGWSARGSE